jgi:hypothetical protein
MSKIRGVFTLSSRLRAGTPRENKGRAGYHPPLRLDKLDHGCARFGPLRARFGRIGSDARPYQPNLMRRRPERETNRGGTPYAASATRPEARRTPGPGTFTELPKNPFIQPLFYHNRISSSKPQRGRGWGCTTDFRVRRVRKTPRKRRTEVRRRGVSSKLPHCRDLDELRPSAGSACCRLGAEAAIGRRFSSAGLPMPERPPPAESRWQT